jgi:hypothetical protein
MYSAMLRLLPLSLLITAGPDSVRVLLLNAAHQRQVPEWVKHAPVQVRRPRAIRMSDNANQRKVPGMSTVNSFTGQDFSQIENAFCRLVDETTDEELARYDLTGSGRHNAQIMAKVSRGGAGEWTMTAIGAIASGRTFQDLLPATAAYL